MELLDKKLTGPGPEISVHPDVTLFLFFFVCVTFFLAKNCEAACVQETTLDWQTDFPPFCN